MTKIIPAVYHYIQREVKTQSVEKDWRVFGLKQAGWNCFLDLWEQLWFPRITQNKALQSWMFALGIYVGEGSVSNEIGWYKRLNIVEYSTISSVNSLIIQTNCSLFLVVLKNNAFFFWMQKRWFRWSRWLGGTSLTEFFTVMSSFTALCETGVDSCESICFLVYFEAQLKSLRTRVCDWINWPSPSGLVTSSSNFPRQKFKIKWGFMTEFKLLLRTLSTMMLSRCVFSSLTVPFVLLVNWGRVPKFFLCSMDVWRSSNCFFMLISVIFNFRVRIVNSGFVLILIERL